MFGGVFRQGYILESAYIFKEKSWEPVVECAGDTLIYSMPVSSGFHDKNFKFLISREEFEVLKRDEERRYFLYAVLHSRYQMHPPCSDLLVDHYIQLILLGVVPEVERLLSLRDAESNGAVSSLAQNYLGRDLKFLKKGFWFKKRYAFWPFSR
ncbi:hypothetical protein PsAD14_05205 [Pseudovibrio sp. Ad14]|nr:hypothetical protein PsW74_00845 [Pseudovibrio sp. W74]KZL04965.1 hypothetical protein PsAD14_05205 [Pseudovibrio sp. Ad14]